MPGSLLLCLLGLAAPLHAQRALPTPGMLKKMSFEQLMEVEVTSVSKRPEKLLKAAAAIQVISGEDVRRHGATSLPEALRLASNLEVAQIDSRQWAITARGFNNVFADKMLVLLDGRSVYTPLYAGVFWDVQDTLLEDLDRIEVISGPGATQWGSNAVNGVINVTTKSAKGTLGGLVVGGGGNLVRSSGAVRYGAQLSPHTYYRVYGKFFRRGESVRSSGRRSGDAWNMNQGGFRLDTLSSGGDPLTIQGDLYGGKMGRFGMGLDSIRVNGANLLGRWVRHLGEQMELKAQVYFDHARRRIPESFDQDIDTSDLDLQYRRPIGSAHDLVCGFGYRMIRDRVVNTPANAFIPPRVVRHSFSAFVQDEMVVRKDLLHLALGTKVEHNDYTGSEFEPSVRLVWTPDGRQTVWSAISRAVRIPSRIDRDLFSPATPPYRIAGGEKVVSEKLISYEAGYRAQFSPSFAVSLASFVNDYDDLRSLEPLNPPLAFPAKASSGLRGRSSGAELSADWRATARLRLQLGWTELRVRSEPKASASSDRGARDSISRDPNHQLSLRSSLDLPGNWECDAHLRYVASLQNQFVPDYTELDLNIGWRPTAEWEFSLRGQNLLHSRHPEFNTPGTRREHPRAWYAKVSWRY
ncbi:MAG: TonB-dependent receptor [Opitutaceae bacterium]